MALDDALSRDNASPRPDRNRSLRRLRSPNSHRSWKPGTSSSRHRNFSCCQTSSEMFEGYFIDDRRADQNQRRIGAVTRLTDVVKTGPSSRRNFFQARRSSGVPSSRRPDAHRRRPGVLQGPRPISHPRWRVLTRFGQDQAAHDRVPGSCCR